VYLEGIALTVSRASYARHGEHRDPPSQPGSEVEKAPDEPGIERIQGLTAKEGPEDGCADSVSARIRRFAKAFP
jgi:hypothetical protein